jgi:hypothetical protein
MDVGWDKLQIGTSNSQPDQYQMWAAGYLEGYFTADSIWYITHSLSLHHSPLHSESC